LTPTPLRERYFLLNLEIEEQKKKEKTVLNAEFAAQTGL
jgi:hypothetical protein